jgi:hypothetical protein
MIETLPLPRLLGLFQKRIDGDDALLHLAGLRFKEMGLGTEFYAETPEELSSLLKFKPEPQSPAVAHLRRGIDLFEKANLDLIIDFATRFKDQVFGFVIHDQAKISTCFEDYVATLKKLELRSKEVLGSPYLFIEYASGLDPELFVEILEAIRDLERVSGCIDIGHVGLWQIRTAYGRKHPEKDVCTLKPCDPELSDVIDDIQDAVRSALDVVLQVIQALGRLGKPLHLHLHDGHPLSTLSPFGISDHLGFLDEIPIPFEYKRKRSLDPMFGPSGLSRIVTESLQALGPNRVSFSLEIHPQDGRLPLGGCSYLFNHWQDKTNAERMNHWLQVILRNHQLVSEACSNSLAILGFTKGVTS